MLKQLVLVTAIGGVAAFSLGCESRANHPDHQGSGTKQQDGSASKNTDGSAAKQQDGSASKQNSGSGSK